MDILVILQTALLYVIRGILEFLNQEGVRLTPGNISYVQNQVMDKLQGMDVMKNFTDQAFIQEAIQGMLLDKLVMLPEDIVSRSSWNAASPKSQKSSLAQPYEAVVIHESRVGQPVWTDEECRSRIRALQEKQMHEMNKNDIAYNFVICGDGTVYEGTGWDTDTDHVPEMGRKSLGVSFLGAPPDAPPSKVSLKLLELLLQDGVTRGKLQPDYQLYTHSQLIDTLCPGSAIDQAVQTLPHWNKDKTVASKTGAFKTASDDV